MLCRLLIAFVLLNLNFVNSEIIKFEEEIENETISKREGKFFGIFGFISGYQIAKLLQPQYYLIGDRWNTFLNVQYDQIPTTKPIKPDNSVKPTYEPEQIFQDTIIVAASSNLTSTPILTPTTTTTKPKLKKLNKKNRLIRASEKPIFLRKEEEEPAATEDDETTVEITTETETETETPEITTVFENLTETTPQPPVIMNNVPNTDFTGYLYQKPTIQFDTPTSSLASSPPGYYDNNLIPDLNKFVPSIGSGSELNRKGGGGYGFSTNNKIELISLTTSYPPVSSLDSFKPSSSDTFQNMKNYW